MIIVQKDQRTCLSFAVGSNFTCASKFSNPLFTPPPPPPPSHLSVCNVGLACLASCDLNCLYIVTVIDVFCLKCASLDVLYTGIYKRLRPDMIFKPFYAMTSYYLISCFYCINQFGLKKNRKACFREHVR